MPTEERLVRADDVVVEDLAGQLLLLRRGGTDVVHLDTVATRVWALLEQPRTRAGLAAALAEEYGVEVDRVASDLVPLLTLLRDKQLVSPA